MRFAHFLAGAVILLAASPSSAGADTQLRKDALELLAPLPEQVRAPPDNDFTPQRINLGRALFSDPRLSADGTQSCASCHDIQKGAGSNGARAVKGHPWQTAPRNVPSILNSSLNEWPTQDPPPGDRLAPNRRAIRGGIDLDRMPVEVLDRLLQDKELVAAFASYYPEDKELGAEAIGKALEAYIATLITRGSPFDRFLAGDDAAIGPIEKIGLASFLDKGCAVCHGGVNLGGASYEAFGIAGQVDVGHTVPPLRVRTSPLRNVGLTAPYFHRGQTGSLEEAVAIMARTQLGDQLLGGDVKALTAFLRALTAAPPAQ